MRFPSWVHRRLPGCGAHAEIEIPLGLYVTGKRAIADPANKKEVSTKEKVNVGAHSSIFGGEMSQFEGEMELDDRRQEGELALNTFLLSRPC